ncbi:hypothetical protein D3C80_1554520 [compost metagenome]
MIGADSCMSNSPEGKMVIGNMADRIIHAPPAEGNASEHFLLDLRLFGKQVQGQRLGTAVHHPNRILHFPESHDRQNRTKKLVLHSTIRPRVRGKQRRLDIKLLSNGCPARQHISLVRFQNCSQSVELALINDSSIVGT